MNSKNLTASEYKYGFVSDIEAEEFPKGLNEEIIRLISVIQSYGSNNSSNWLIIFGSRRMIAFVVKILKASHWSDI